MLRSTANVILRLIIIAVFMPILTACQTIESMKSANTQNIVVNTPGVEGADCDLSDRTGRKWRLWGTPGTVAVQEGHPPLIIVCTKKNYKKSILTINEQKEEILTIDGKRIDLSLYGHFPTKFPRLIPSAIKEVAGFAQDPTGSISTKYPTELAVWMEPKVWESEEQMREFAFEREAYERAADLDAMDEKEKDELRKIVRRQKRDEREEYRRKLTKRFRDAGKKGVKNTLKVVNPEPKVDDLMQNSSQAIDGTMMRYNKAEDLHSEDVAEKTTKTLRAVRDKTLKNTENVVDSVNPYSAVDTLNDRNKVKANTRKKREAEQRQEAIDGSNLKTTDRKVEDKDLPQMLPYGYSEDFSLDDTVTTRSKGKDQSKNQGKKSKTDEKMPQDLFKSDEKKYRYDDNGKRVVE